MRILKGELSINEPAAIAGYLVQAGYGQMDALGALVVVYRPSADAIQMLTRVIETVYPEEQNSLKLALQVFRATDPGTATIVLHMTAGYTLNDIARTLKDVYNCTAGDVIGLLSEYHGDAKTLAVILEVFPGVDPILAKILADKQKYNDDAGLSRSRLEGLGITDPLQVATYLISAGYAESDVLGVVIIWYPRSMYLVLKNLYGATDLDTMANLFRQAPLNAYYDLSASQWSVPRELQMAFPDKTTADVALALKRAGFTVDRYKTSGPPSGVDMVDWLRGIARNERRNDALAAILGPVGLGLDVVYTREILQKQGYDPVEIATRLKANNYSSSEILLGLQILYDEPTVNCFKSLKTMQEIGYGIDDLFEAEAGLVRDLSRFDYGYFWCLSDLFDIGYSFAEITQAYVKAGGPVSALPLDLWEISVRYYNKDMHGAIATGLYKGHHLSATVVASLTYDGMLAAKQKKALSWSWPGAFLLVQSVPMVGRKSSRR